MIKKIWQTWKKIAEKIGSFQFKVIFSILYYLLITPIGFVIAQFSDYLGKRSNSWSDFEDNSSDLVKLKKQ